MLVSTRMPTVAGGVSESACTDRSRGGRSRDAHNDLISTYCKFHDF